MNNDRLKSGLGLENTVAGDTELCLMGENVGGLFYLGYDAIELAKSHDFELVAYLLTRKQFPNKEEYQAYLKRLESLSKIPEEIIPMLKFFKDDTDPMDLLRTVVSYMGVIYPEHDRESFDQFDRLLVLMPRILGLWRERSVESDDSIAVATLKACSDAKITEENILAMNSSLILYAEHEFNASTFACRVTTATKSCIYSAICSGIGTLKGPLHGGANRDALNMMIKFNNVDEAITGAKSMLDKKIKIPGFGHRVYRTGDPRSHHLHILLKDRAAEPALLKIAESIEGVVYDQKKIIPNVDFYTAVLYDELKIPENLFVSLFVVGRMAGWLGHVREQRENNRLIRPTSNYVGSSPKGLLW